MEAEETEGGSSSDNIVVVGMALCITAAFLLALSMNLQQYALSCPNNAKIIQIVPRTVLWGFGMFIYLLAQLTFICAVSMGPFAVMSEYLFMSLFCFRYSLSYLRWRRCVIHQRPGIRYSHRFSGQGQASK